MQRRHFLLGAQGVVMSLPFLEGLVPREARGGTTAQPPFALLYRKPNGCAHTGHGQIGGKERFWPELSSGATLDDNNIPDENNRSVGALTKQFWSRTSVIKGLAHPFTDWGHENGLRQMFSGARLDWNPPGGSGEQRTWTTYRLRGESLDTRIARELTGQSSSIAMLLSGAPVDYSCSFSQADSGNGDRVAVPLVSDFGAVYRRLFSGANTDSATFTRLAAERKSINDLVRERLKRLRASSKLSKADQDRLDAHTSSIRDLEKILCNPGQTDPDLEALAKDAGARNQYPLDQGRSYPRREGADLIGRLAALAISCGLTRSVVVSGSAFHSDAYNYADEFPNEWQGMSGNMHEEVSHQDLSNDRYGRAYQTADIAHVRMFVSILKRLDAVDVGNGQKLLDQGVALWMSDISNGSHNITDIPALYVGGAGGALKTGKYVDVFKDPSGKCTYSQTQTEDPSYRMRTFEPTVKLLNTIGAAVGCKNASNGPLDDLNADNNAIDGQPIKGRIDSLVNS